MSLAGAPAAAPISLAAATGRALPRRLLALIADTVVISLLDEIVNGTFGVTRVTSGVATTMGTGGWFSVPRHKAHAWSSPARDRVTHIAAPARPCVSCAGTPSRSP